MTALIALTSLFSSIIGNETLSTIPDGLSVMMILGFTSWRSPSAGRSATFGANPASSSIGAA